MEPCIRIMFSERSPHHRNRVKQVIKTQRDFEIIFEGKSILEDNKNRLIEKTDIFVVGLDKFQTGWDLILSPLVNLSRKTKILILSEPMQGEMMLWAMQAGIQGFLPKSIKDEELIFAIREISRGGIWFQKRAGKLRPERTNEAKKTGKAVSLKGLTPQEIRVCEMVGQGFRNKEIATYFHLSEKTIKCHVHNIFTKLGINKRAKLMEEFIKTESSQRQFGGNSI